MVVLTTLAIMFFYEADTPAEVDQAFKNAVEDYLDVCREEGHEPQGRMLMLD